MEPLNKLMRQVARTGIVPGEILATYTSVEPDMTVYRVERVMRWSLLTLPRHIRSKELMSVVYHSTLQFLQRTRRYHVAREALMWATRVLLVTASRSAKLPHTDYYDTLCHVATAIGFVTRLHNRLSYGPMMHTWTIGVFSDCLLSRRLVCLLHRVYDHCRGDEELELAPVYHKLNMFLTKFAMGAMDQTPTDSKWLMYLLASLMTHPAGEMDLTTELNNICAHVYRRLLHCVTHPFLRGTVMVAALIKATGDTHNANGDETNMLVNSETGVCLARILGMVAPHDANPNPKTIVQCIQTVRSLMEYAPAVAITLGMCDMYCGILQMPSTVVRACVSAKELEDFVDHLRSRHESDFMSETRLCYHIARVSMYAVKVYERDTTLASNASMVRAGDCPWACWAVNLDTESAVIGYVEAILDINARRGGDANAHYAVRRMRMYANLKSRWPRHNALVYLSLFEKARAMVNRQPRLLVQWKRFHSETAVCDHLS